MQKCPLNFRQAANLMMWSLTMLHVAMATGILGAPTFFGQGFSLGDNWNAFYLY